MAPRAAVKRKAPSAASSSNEPAAAPSASTAAPSIKKQSWTGHPSAKKRGGRTHWPPLAKLLLEQVAVDDEIQARDKEREKELEVDGAASEVRRKRRPYVRFVDIEASHALRPTPRVCDLTGLPAPYTDPQSSLRFASAGVFQFVHEQLSDFDVQALLRVRNAGQSM